MTRSRLSKSRALKLFALAAICSVGLVALPAVASAAAPTCQVLDNSGVPLVDNTISVSPSSVTNLRLACTGDTAITHYEIDNTSSTGYFADGVSSGAGTDVLDASNHGQQMWGAYHAPSTSTGDAFTFTGYDTGGTPSALVVVSVLVGLPAPVCTITANDGQNVAKNTSATPVAFTCSDNGDGHVSLSILGGSFGDATLAAVATDGRSGSVDYAAGTDHGTDSDVQVFASTANSLTSSLHFTYHVTDAAPVCSTINDTLQGGQDEQLLVDYTAACHDANNDSLEYTVTDSSGTSGSLDDGNPGIYDESPDHFEDTTSFTDTFQVTASDGANDTVFTVHILVNPNHPPTCTVNSGDDGQNVVHGGASITIGIHCSDQDTSALPQNDEFNAWFDEDALATQGSVQLNDAGDTLTYSPYWSGLGSDTIALVVTQNNDEAQHSTLLVHVNVTDASAPACADISLAMTNASSAGADLGCTDADGDFVDYYVDQAPLNGTVSQSGSGSTIAYVPNPGFVGTDTFTMIADDGARQTPITVTAHVSAAAPVVTPPAVTPPAVIPPAVTPTAPKVSGPVTLKGGAVTLALGCADTTTSCKASVGLSTTIGGKKVDLGSKSITIKPGKDGKLKVMLSGDAKKALKAFAGKTITVKVAVKTTNPKTGKTTTATRSVKVHLPK